MFTKNNLLKPLSVAAITLLVFATSCKDKEKENVTETVTTNTTANPDSANRTQGDSVTTTTTTTSTESTKKVATYGKPNPAKKGGKGRLVFLPWKVNVNEKIEMDKEGVYSRADIMPSFPGGEKALTKYLEDNLKYPEAAIEDGVEGTVELVFAVDEMGKVYAPMLKSEKMGYGLEDEAMRVIRKMPNWNPGSIKGRNVKTRFNLPVSFVIN